MSESKSITTRTPGPGLGPGGYQPPVKDWQSKSSESSDSSITTSDDESTLATPTPGPGDSPSQCQQTVNDRLQQTLAAAERSRGTVRRRARMHMWAMYGAAVVLLLVGGFANLVAVVARGEQKKIAIIVLGGLVGLVGLYLLFARGSSEPEASCLRMLELDRYIFDLNVFMLKHGRRTWSGIGPEMRVSVVRKEYRLKKITDSSVDGLSILSLHMYKADSDGCDSV